MGTRLAELVIEGKQREAEAEARRILMQQRAITEQKRQQSPQR